MDKIIAVARFRFAWAINSPDIFGFLILSQSAISEKCHFKSFRSFSFKISICTNATYRFVVNKCDRFRLVGPQFGNFALLLIFVLMFHTTVIFKFVEKSLTRGINSLLAYLLIDRKLDIIN